MAKFKNLVLSFLTKFKNKNLILPFWLYLNYLQIALDLAFLFLELN